MRPVVLFTNSPFMGGMEEHILHLGRGLVGQGTRVGLVCSARPEIEPLRERARDAGMHVHGIGEREAGAAGSARRLGALVHTLRGYRGAVLHMHLTGHVGGELVQVAGRLAGVRATVRTEHLPPMPPIADAERRGVRLRDRLLDRVICVSQATALDHIRDLGRDARKFRVVPNCVEVERFDPAGTARAAARASLGCVDDAPLIGTVSRLGERRKGLHHFLDMAAAVLVDRPRARFVIVGDGALRADLEHDAHSLGLAEKVVFTGERTDIPTLLGAMDVFVMPSLYEGGPITVLEAMAMARPVVSTPVGMVPDVIQDGVNGCLVPTADSPALTAAVCALLDDPALAARLGQQARETVARSFSPKAMVDGVLNVYREVV